MNATTSPLSPRSLGIVSLLLATSSWGAMFLVGKDVLQHVDPFWFTIVRYTLSALLFVALLLPRGRAPWQRLRRHAGPLAWRGVAGFGVFSVMLLEGLSHSAPSHGAVIMATVPMTTQLLRWALDGVRPTRTAVLTAVLALAGVATVAGVFSSGDAFNTSYLLGDALALAGTLGWIVYTRGAARMPELDVVEYTALTVLASWPLLLLGTLAATAVGLSTAPSAEGLQQTWHGLLFAGVLSSAVAVLAFNHGVRRLGAVTATAFLNFVPVSALLMSVALGKPPTAAELLGIAMVVTALLVHTAASRSPARSPATSPALPPCKAIS